MASSPSPQMAHQNDEQWLALIVLSLVGAALFLWVYLEKTVYYTCALLHALWGLLLPFGFISPLRHLAAGKYNLLAATANHAASVSVSQWLDVMRQTLPILDGVLFPLCFAGLVIWWKHPSQARFTRRDISVGSLPQRLRARIPQLHALLVQSRGHKRLLQDPKDNRRFALTPEEFVSQHHLVSHQELDEPAAAAMFLAQAGPELTGWKSLRPHHRALFAVFGLQYFLNDRPAAEALLDTLNRSCRLPSRRDNRQGTCPVWTLANADFKRVASHPQAKAWLGAHRYVRSGLVWLYSHDLRLTPPRWRWLKGVDRPLWYALHRANAQKGFIEGAGIVAIARNEGQARDLGLPCPRPDVRTAVAGLKDDLIRIGLLWAPTSGEESWANPGHGDWAFDEEAAPPTVAAEPAAAGHGAPAQPKHPAQPAPAGNPAPSASASVAHKAPTTPAPADQASSGPPAGMFQI